MGFSIDKNAFQQMDDKVARLSGQPLIPEAFRGDEVCQTLRRSLFAVGDTVHALRETIRATKRTNKFECIYEQFRGKLCEVFGNNYMQPHSISNDALQAIRRAKRGRPTGLAGIQMGHGTTDDTLGQAQFMRQLLIEGADDEILDLEKLGKYLTRHNKTCIITKAQNDVDAQLRPDEMQALPADGTLFWRQGRACKFGKPEIAWVKTLPVV